MAKKARKVKDAPPQEELTAEGETPAKIEEANTEQGTDDAVVPSNDLQSYLDKSNAELREICRSKGIKKFASLKHADLARVALEGTNQPNAGAGMRNDQLRMRLRELGLHGVAGKRADLVSRIAEAEEFIMRVQAAMDKINPGTGATVDASTFKGDAKNLLNLLLDAIEKVA